MHGWVVVAHVVVGVEDHVAALGGYVIHSSGEQGEVGFVEGSTKASFEGAESFLRSVSLIEVFESRGTNKQKW